MKTDQNGELALDDYNAVGGIENALSKHADEALAALSEEEERIAEVMFQALTTTDHGGRKTRRPAHLDELVKLTGVQRENIFKVINHFNDDKRCFLVINKSVETNNPLIDISHESLIRQWEKLVEWVNKETESAKNYLRLSEAARLNNEGQKDLLRGAELQGAMNWQTKQHPNAAWAARYNDSYEEAINFLDKSKIQAKKERNAGRIRKIIYGVAALFLVGTLITSYWFKKQQQQSMAGEQTAKKERNVAEKARLMSLKSAEEAQLAKEVAIIKQREADSSAMIAIIQQKVAVKNQIEANRQKEMADKAKMVAEQEVVKAQDAKQRADTERSKAELKADSIKNLLDAINSQKYYATADSIAAAKSKSFTEKALKNIDIVINQTIDTASIGKLKAITRELQAGIFPERNDDNLIHSITVEQVKQVMPKARVDDAGKFVSAFNKVMNKYEINTSSRIAAFLAQVAKSSGSLYFMTEPASGAAYEGRVTLGNTEPGDGIKYKGRGFFQFTGRANYTSLSNPPEYDLVNHPELLSTFSVATDVSCRWWKEKGLNEFADKGDLPALEKRINGSLSGLASTTEFYLKAKQVFGK